MEEYDYGMMFQGMTLTPGIADATSGEVAKGLTMGSGKLMQGIGNALKTLNGGGWEIVSHSFLRIDRHLIVSFVIRREHQNKQVN